MSTPAGSETRLNASREYRGVRCFVTGHTGFKGAWLCQWLCRAGARVTGYATDPPTTPSLFLLAGVGRKMTAVTGDVRDGDRLASELAAARPDIVFHLAAQAIVRESYRRPGDTFDVNTGGTVRLLEAVRACPSVRAVVVVTSDKCYENPGAPAGCRETDPLGGRDPYSASKAAAEMVVAAYRHSFFGENGVRAATCRAGNVIGGGDWAPDRIVPDMVRALAAGRPAPVRNPGHIRPWQHVLDPLNGYLTVGARLLRGDGGEGAWNFGPEAEANRPVAELAGLFLREYRRGSWEHVPPPAGEAPHEAPALTLSCEKALAGLGWRPRWDFETAVARTALWHRRLEEGADAAALCAADLEAHESP